MSTIRPTSHQTHPTISDLVKHPKAGQTELFLVRHGQTAANADGILAGVTDIPLDPLGIQQARQVAERFREIAIDALVTSPLERARRTAEEIGRVTGLGAEVVPGLSEIDFGTIEGLTVQQVLQQFPELQRHMQDFSDLDLAWPGGESRRGFAERVMTTILGLLERYERHRVGVVCHDGVIGTFLASLDMGPRDDLIRFAVANCSITHLVVTPEHTRIELWNDFSHLEKVQVLDPALVRRKMEDNA